MADDKTTTHKTVLLKEAIEGLDIHKGDVVVDGTLGGGGHSLEIARQFGRDITLIGIDMDQKAIERSSAIIGKVNPHVLFFRNNFRNIRKVLEEANVSNANRIILDIGLSSDQFELSGRGFTFRKDEPLLMTFSDDPKLQQFTAKEIVNEWQESSIADVIYGYGEEKFSRRIAQAIIRERKTRSIDTTFELVHIIESAVPFWYRKGKLHPATKTFQALRITVNDELEALKMGLSEGFDVLAQNGRMSVISFHSLEDRIVKRYFRSLKEEGKAIVITKKAVIPSEEEISENPRSRSAKLRIIQKII